MSFHIDKHEAPESEFRRVLCGQLTRAIKELNQSSPALQARTVHQVRKRIKKIRSVLRLLHFASPRAIPQAYHTPLRKAAEEIAAIRDAFADARTMAALCKHTSIAPSRFTGVFKFLAQGQKTASAGSGAAMHKAAALLTSARSAMEKWEDDHLKWHDLPRGVARIYKRCHTSFRKASGEKSAENLHRWRRRTKDVLHILLLLKKRGPKKAISKHTHHARKLCVLLGKDHDLVHLRETLDQCAIGVETETLNELIHSRRLKLQDKIMKLGPKLLAEKSKDFAAECLG
ncbi:MAG: CHAD domain-containing protein [Chthoniobacteraceae bacterium]